MVGLLRYPVVARQVGIDEHRICLSSPTNPQSLVNSCSGGPIMARLPQRSDPIFPLRDYVTDFFLPYTIYVDGGISSFPDVEGTGLRQSALEIQVRS